MKLISKNLFKILFAVLFAALSALIFTVFFPQPTTAKAEENGYSALLPKKSEEYYAVNSPIHAYSDNEITAITTEDRELLLFYADGTVKTIKSTTPLKQVIRFNDYLLYSDNLTVTAVNLYDLTKKTKLSYTDNNGEIKDLNNVFFDAAETASGFIIATTNNRKLQLFTIDDDLNVSLLPYSINSNGGVSANDAPVAVNSKSVFYISDNSLKRINFDTPDTTENYYLVSPSFMIADENYVYYVDGSDIFKLPVSDKTPVKLTVNGGDYDLGNIHSPKGLSFKNGNMLIADVNGFNGSVQEYAITGDALEFTGYAVASGLSAYNRIGLSAKNIERYGNFVAVLDNKKLTVIDTENIENYNKDGFINLFVGDAPARFALGNDTVLYSKGTTVNLVSSITNGEIRTVNHDFSFAPVDISYQSGKYYALYTDGTDSNVAVIDEITGEILNTVKFSDASAKITANVVCADVFKNIYVADNSVVYVCGAEDGRITNYPYGDYFTRAKKLATDLAGKLFALSADGKIYTLNIADGGDYEFTSAYETELGKIKTFGLNFDKKETYFLIDEREEVYFTTDLHNAALSDFMPNAEYNAATESKTALKVYTAKSTANVYSVKATETEFIFGGLIEIAEEYPRIAEITVDSLTMYALAGEKGVVLINGKELTEKSVEFTAAPEKAFITTAVSAYAIPVIDRNGTFALRSSSGVIRLNKGAEISALRAFNVLGKTFYEAETVVDGALAACYIPADFTTETLSEDLKFDAYEIETVKSTALYKNKDLTEELFTLTDGATVKVLERKNGVLKVLARTSGGEEIVGYISEKGIKTNPDLAVRNVLIILAAIGSLAGTVSYFLLRKQK